MAKDGGALRLLTRVLAALAAALALVILAGTLYALARPPGTPAPGEEGPPAAVPPAGPTPAESAPPPARDAGTVLFTGIGRLRIAAGNGPSPASPAPPGSPAAVVLSVVFPYPPGDRPFAEELAGAIPRFRRIVREYFGALSPDELRSLDEGQVKAELLRRFNGELRLGAIELLLFDEFLILE